MKNIFKWSEEIFLWSFAGELKNKAPDIEKSAAGKLSFVWQSDQRGRESMGKMFNQYPLGFMEGIGFEIWFATSTFSHRFHFDQFVISRRDSLHPLWLLISTTN